MNEEHPKKAVEFYMKKLLSSFVEGKFAPFIMPKGSYGIYAKMDYNLDTSDYYVSIQHHGLTTHNAITGKDLTEVTKDTIDYVLSDRNFK
jgi:hypothetical protein